MFRLTTKSLSSSHVCLCQFIVEVQRRAQIPPQYVCSSTEGYATSGRFTELVPAPTKWLVPPQPSSLLHGTSIAESTLNLLGFNRLALSCSGVPRLVEALNRCESLVVEGDR